MAPINMSGLELIIYLTQGDIRKLNLQLWGISQSIFLTI